MEFSVKVRAIILNEGKLLTVKHPHNTSFVALPGGHLEKDEDIKDGLIREMFEELGIKPEIGRLLYVNNYTQQERQYVEFFFEVKNSADYLNINNKDCSHAFEIAEICWLNPTDSICIMPKSLDEDFRKEKLISNEVRFIRD